MISGLTFENASECILMPSVGGLRNYATAGDRNSVICAVVGKAWVDVSAFIFQFLSPDLFQ